MYTLIIGFIILISILLILVVLAQNPKGGGLSSEFGGSGASQIMGVKKTGDFLEKATWVLAISILVLTLVTNTILEQPTNPLEEGSINVENAQQVQPQSAPVTPVPEQTNQSETNGLDNALLNNDSTE